MKTIDNPGSFTPYQFKSSRQIASSVFQRLRVGKFLEAFNFVATEALNKLYKKEIFNKNGKYYCPLCEKHSGAFIHVSNSYRYSLNSVCPYCSSIARHRGLSVYYKKVVLNLGVEHKVLHFAQSLFLLNLKRQIFYLSNHRLCF